MSMPVLNPAGELIYDQQQPWAIYDPQKGYALAWICAALGVELGDVFDAMQLGWDDMMDPNIAPEWELPHLAMWAGVKFVPNGLTVEQKRARVLSTDGLKRGTVGALIGAARQHLTGSRRVKVFERTNPDDPGDQPYHFTVVTYASETADAGSVEAAIREQKPVGLILHYLVQDGWFYLELADAYTGQTYADLAADFATYDDLRANTP